MSQSFPHYPSILADMLPVLPLLYSNRPRSVHADAVRIASRLNPPLQVHGQPPQLSRGLFLVNHYGRPGFPSWWIGVALSSVIPTDIHWVMTAAWRFEQGFRAHVVTPFTRWLFARLARLYDFTTMPPMPPRPDEVRERAASIRQLVSLVQERTDILIGLAPEGDDSEQRALGTPPAGAGRVIRLLASKGLIPVPVGVYEAEGALHIRLGNPVQLPPPPPDRTQDDLHTAAFIMRAIAACLPEELRGEYA